MTKEEILQTEYSSYFDELRKDRMIVSFYKYGPVKENYGNKLVDGIKSLEMRWEAFKETGNLEFLADIANLAMINFMYPQHPKAHFDNRSVSPGVCGMTYREIEGMNI